jgi:hypothetical protein
MLCIDMSMSSNSSSLSSEESRKSVDDEPDDSLEFDESDDRSSSVSESESLFVA